MVSLKKSSKVLTFSGFWDILFIERARISSNACGGVTVEELFFYLYKVLTFCLVYNIIFIEGAADPILDVALGSFSSMSCDTSFLYLLKRLLENIP